MNQILTVENEETKERLDKFLSRCFPEYSRARLQKLIKEGGVDVNGKKVSVHFFLKAGDTVEIDLPEKENQKIKPEKNENLEIVAENADFLIINKPPGLLVHPTAGQQEKTLANQLLYYCPSLKNVGDDETRPGLVHRLDKEVSGLMVVAKHQKAFEHLKNQFQSHKVKKGYLTLVYNQVNREEGVIDFPISRAKTGLFVARPKNQAGKEAITCYKVIKRFPRYTLLAVRTLTGRSHQIRVHLKALDHPIVGDQLYKNKKLKEKIKLDRIFLHASSLGFFGLDNQWYEYEKKLPPDLNKVIDELGGKT